MFWAQFSFQKLRKKFFNEGRVIWTLNDVIKNSEKLYSSAARHCSLQLQRLLDPILPESRRVTLRLSDLFWVISRAYFNGCACFSLLFVDLPSWRHTGFVSLHQYHLLILSLSFWVVEQFLWRYNLQIVCGPKRRFSCRRTEYKPLAYWSVRRRRWMWMKSQMFRNSRTE